MANGCVCSPSIRQFSRATWQARCPSVIKRYAGYVPRNLTLSIDADLLQAARKVARERNTSVNQMVREYLAATVRGSGRQLAAVAKLDELFRTTRARVGAITWNRDDLHER
jgi:hypothetical protein